VPVPPAKERLTEFAEQVEKIVWYRLAKRIVIDRAQCTPEVALAAAAVGSSGPLRVPGMSGSLRLASLLRTQLLVPPSAGPALIINSSERATGSRRLRHPDTHKAGHCAALFA
jgi:hypothetical protein